MFSFVFVSLGLKYSFSLFAVDGKKYRPNYFILTLGLILSIVADFLKREKSQIDMVAGIIAVTVCFFMAFFPYFKNKPAKFLLLFAMVLTFDETVSKLISFSIKREGPIFEKVLPESISVLIIVLIYEFSKKIHRWDNKENYLWNNRIYIMFSLILIEILLTVSMFTYTIKDLPTERTVFIALVLCIGAFISISSFVVLFMYLKRSNDKLTELIEKDEEMYSLQKIYYDSLLRKEESTRQFRHDIKNHIMCIKQLSSKKDFERLDKYLMQFETDIANLDEGVYSTGNNVVDMMLTYYLRRVKDIAKISVSGVASFNTDEIYLCTIFSNLLKNAVEEIERINEPEKEKHICVRIEGHGEYSSVTITNTSTGLLNVENLVSVKKSVNHGYGIKNVKEAVRNAHGRIEMESSEQEFTVKVILPAV